jgi:hypothetical protein
MYRTPNEGWNQFSRIGDNEFFIPIGKEDEVPGWTNSSAASYDNWSGGSFFDKFMDSGGPLMIAAAFAAPYLGAALAPTWGATAQAALGGALTGGFSSAATGGDFLKGAMLGGIGGGAGTALTGAIGDYSGLGFLSNDFMGPLSFGESMTKGALSGAVSGGLKGAVSGGNPWESALQGGLMGAGRSAISGLDLTGTPSLDTAIERGLLNTAGAGLFGGDMESTMLGSAVDIGSIGFGDMLGLTDKASMNISSAAQKILRSKMTAKQKQEALKKLQQRRPGLMTSRAG